MRRAYAVAGVALAVVAMSPARSHNAGVSTSRIVIAGRTVEVEINALARDYEQAAGVRIADKGSGEVNPVALAVMAPAILSYVGDHAAVLAGDQRCAPGTGTAKAADTHVLVTIPWRCPPDGDLRYRVTLFQDVDPAARHVALIAAENGERELALDKNAPEIALSGAAPSLLLVVGRFIEAGIEHIFLGYDHIAFLLAVILWGQRLWPLVKVVTAFTVAHSITLSLAALQIFAVPSAIVEPAIAASIIVVAAENFFSRNVDRRWPVTFAFGLVHGFGFASALQEIGLPPNALVPALAAFNIGVEIGQIVIVALVFPLLLLSDRIGRGGAANKGRHPALVYSGSAAILTLGLWWLIERTVFA
jgi:hydrogenase/urease accessory protein HupE